MVVVGLVESDRDLCGILALQRANRAETADGFVTVVSARWYVMGQVAVAESHRGRGVFDALYAEHRARYGERFDAVVTEVATRNRRSMRAHARVGFRTICVYRDVTDEWAVIVWDWSVG